MGTLLALSIGPVQGFIAAARKTRDLWYGSYLLSETARCMALALREAGAQLIFPAPSSLNAGQGDGQTPVANHIVAVAPDGADPASLVEHARQAAASYLRRQRDRALDRVRDRDAIDWELLERQIDGFLELYAAWYPYDGTQEGYQTAREGVESLLAGRKALRDFAPAPPTRQRVPMSALDGGRASVLRSKDGGLDDLDIRDREHLDGVSLVKRLAADRRFVSVPRIAADGLLRRLRDDPRMDKLKRLAGELDGTGLMDRIPTGTGGFAQFDHFPFDSELLVRDKLEDRLLAETGLNERQGQTAHCFHELLRDMSRHAGVAEPPAYLAVLVADGDKVGALISSLAAQGPAAHRAFSEAGVDFARAARKTVADHYGALIYSGGDDVLALVPLDTALACAGALNGLFRTTMARAFQALPDVKPPTLSVGLAIGHWHEDLRNLLSWGRAAEARAKRFRDTLAVALHTRSGGAGAVTAAHAWPHDPLRRWRHWIDWYRDDVLPDGAAYELRALARELRGLVRGGHDVSPIVEAECGRILRRKKGKRGTRELSEGEIRDALDLALRRDRAGMTQGTQPPALLDRLEETVNEMIIARHVERAERLAGGVVAARAEAAHG